MGTVMSVTHPDIQKQSAALKPISTGAAHHVDKQSGSKKKKSTEECGAACGFKRSCR